MGNYHLSVRKKEGDIDITKDLYLIYALANSKPISCISYLENVIYLEYDNIKSYNQVFNYFKQCLANEYYFYLTKIEEHNDINERNSNPLMELRNPNNSHTKEFDNVYQNELNEIKNKTSKSILNIEFFNLPKF